MGILSFIIVLGFNLSWILADGYKSFVDRYKWSDNGRFSIAFWLFAAWGVFNLVYSII